MPELPEVETVRRGLNEATRSRQILGGYVLHDRSIAHPISPADFLTNIKDVAIARWHRRGKYLLAELIFVSEKTELPVPAGWLGVHLRMTGQLLWVCQDEPIQKHARVRLLFGDRWELRFVDIRTFGRMWWVPQGVAPEEIIRGLKLLGPEPFEPEFSIEYLAGKLSRSRRAVKTALLDQAIVAGLGNIYADEVLFLSGIPPTKICAEITNQQIEKLHGNIIQVLENAIAAGGTTFSNFLNVRGVNGNYAGMAWVYRRAGQPCRVCGTTIQRQKLGGRSTHFCPQCQK